ncbi:hypothetical protein EPUS_07467 [Endocarpon pusillum Z07020]|uniref:Tc toxin complex TcA C-terminal TcB-binding domain-containing protein n=1 Tax=Endocarpon pusillum (strain Z07020 / HMAS-L-300199) TaxID=1263415 RepID=U1HTU8_ENDPU|nr:uncharacterized protein EPUS_07467 [Endocarpon pusillum Z07020]ERF72674.1 hypothetical protein EPUS_07467 [Endocarpon pusillum Z07020]
MQKQIEPEDDHSMTIQDRFSSEDPDTRKARPMWELRLGYTTYQNGKWTQKQLSEMTLRHAAREVEEWDLRANKGGDDKDKWKTRTTYLLPNQTAYRLCPRLISDSELRVDISYRDSHKNVRTDKVVENSFRIGYFTFENGSITSKSDSSSGDDIDTITSFQYDQTGSKAEISSYQVKESETSSPPLFGKFPKVQYDKSPAANAKSHILLVNDTGVVFNHTFIDPLLAFISKDNTAHAFDDFYDQFGKLAHSAASDDPFGATDDGSFNEKLSPVPQSLRPERNRRRHRSDRRKQALWKFEPFKDLANKDAKVTLEQMFLRLRPQTSNDDINEWRDNPFSPHSIGRNRPVAYMKWVAMKYIEIMIAYGDYFFRQNSLETIPNAIQCYVIASHVYGQRGQKIPKRGKTKPETYASLLDRWDAFGNAIVQLELEFPFSNQTSLPIGVSTGIVGLANIFGFASALYFCIPDNPKLRELRDTIDDRLYKIRNCMDINGVVRHLPLFDPPIDPALLVQATAQGLSLDSVLNDIGGPMPNYRFQLLLQKAFDICAELKSLGGAFLTAKEKKDGEALSVLRTTHEATMSNMTLDIRQRQVNETSQALEQLLQSRNAPSYKLQFYRKLIGNTESALNEDTDFNEIPNPSLQDPNSEGELLLNEPDVEALAAVFHAIPSSEASAKPWGVGAGLVWGGFNFGHSTNAAAKALQVYATWLTQSSSRAGIKANLMRQMQDRIFQANAIGMELKNIDKQIATHRIRLSTAEQETKNQEKQLEQTTAVQEFLKSKYTNEELYIWMEGQTRDLYQQSYNHAFDLAKRAEKAFKFERPDQTTDFINMGYWTNARDGLLAGEQLHLSLKRLESAYQETLGHDFEMTKHISIRQWAPLGLVEFRETGSFEFDLPEILFDMDCPGHYMRRIVSASQHSIRTTARASGKADYPRQLETEDDRFSTYNIPISAIALSTGQADHGRHEGGLTMTTSSERYNPFEGAGVISKWRFDLPASFRAFDYGSITDVVLTLKYTSRDGGDKLRDTASGAVADFVKQMIDTSASGRDGLFMFFDLKAEFATECLCRKVAVGGSGTDAEEVTMQLSNVYERLPAFTRMTKPNRLVALAMVLVVRTGDVFSSPPSIAPDQVGIDLLPNADQNAAFRPASINLGDANPNLVGFSSEDLQLPMTNWGLRVKGSGIQALGNTEARAWLVVKYAMT